MERKYKKTDFKNPLFLQTFISSAIDDGYRVEENNDYYYLLLSTELLIDGVIVDNENSYNILKKERYIEIEINDIEDELSKDDYKITKCYEASLLGEELPYNIQELHTNRQAKRDKINELRNLLIKK